MNAAQLQNTTHLEPITVYTWPSGNNRQLASSLLGSIIPMYTWMNWVCVGSDIYQTRYTTCGGVLSSIAKTALVCPWLSYSGITLPIDKVHTLSLIMYTSRCPNKTAYTASLLKSSGPFSRILNTCSLALNLAASAHWVEWFFLFLFLQQVVCKQSTKTRPPPAGLSVPVGARWGLSMVQTDQSLPFFFLFLFQHMDQIHQTQEFP